MLVSVRVINSQGAFHIGSSHESRIKASNNGNIFFRSDGRRPRLISYKTGPQVRTRSSCKSLRVTAMISSGFPCNASIQTDVSSKHDFLLHIFYSIFCDMKCTSQEKKSHQPCFFLRIHSPIAKKQAVEDGQMNPGRQGEDIGERLGQTKGEQNF